MTAIFVGLFGASLATAYTHIDTKHFFSGAVRGYSVNSIVSGTVAARTESGVRPSGVSRSAKTQELSATLTASERKTIRPFGSQVAGRIGNQEFASSLRLIRTWSHHLPCRSSAAARKVIGS